MKLIITLLHEGDEDRETGCIIAGSAKIVLQYPKTGHIVVDADAVTIDDVNEVPAEATETPE